MFKISEEYELPYLTKNMHPCQKQRIHNENRNYQMRNLLNYFWTNILLIFRGNDVWKSECINMCYIYITLYTLNLSAYYTIVLYLNKINH